MNTTKFICLKCEEHYPYYPGGGCNECGSSIFVEIPSPELAQFHANICSGENAIIISSIDEGNVVELRNKFLNNVQFNGARSHKSILVVLNYMYKFIKS